MITETFLYIRLKRFLRYAGWQVVGGQPPSGTDHIPVLEIKAGNGVAKGSLGSFKPDLVAFRESTVLVIEIKPRFTKSDVDKVADFMSSKSRQDNFVLELEQRGVLEAGSPLGNLITFEGAIAYAGAAGDALGLTTFLWEGSHESGGFVQVKSR